MGAVLWSPEMRRSRDTAETGHGSAPASEESDKSCQIVFK